MPSSAPHHTGSRPPCRGLLIVDDDADIREVLTEVLEDEGYDVRHAANGRDALDQLKQWADLPCLILLDLMMPVMDGWQFRNAQLQDAKLADIPVVVLTADGRAQYKASSMQVVEGLAKPLRIADLLRTIRKYCGTPA